MSSGGAAEERVLVISPSDTLVRRVASALAPHQMEVEHVVDGKALARHRRHRPFLLCLADVRGANGAEVAAHYMRARPSERFVLVLGLWQCAEEVAGKESGQPFGYLREPFQKREISAWVRRAAAEVELLRGDQSLEELLYGRFRQFVQNLGSQRMSTLHELIWERVERPLITVVLEHTGGNQSRAAEILGVHRNTLRAKIRSLHIDLSRFSG